jgi:hypothetical protein
MLAKGKQKNELKKNRDKFYIEIFCHKRKKKAVPC